jgi:hypothetical protein
LTNLPKKRLFTFQKVIFGKLGKLLKDLGFVQRALNFAQRIGRSFSLSRELQLRIELEI